MHRKIWQVKFSAKSQDCRNGEAASYPVGAINSIAAPRKTTVWNDKEDQSQPEYILINHYHIFKSGLRRLFIFSLFSFSRFVYKPVLNFCFQEERRIHACITT